MLGLIIELTNIVLEMRLGVRDRRDIEVLIDTLYEEYARSEAEREWED